MCIFIILLDATKAFDRVNYCKLFSKLLSRNVSPVVLILLLCTLTSLLTSGGEHVLVINLILQMG